MHLCICMPSNSLMILVTIFQHFVHHCVSSNTLSIFACLRSTVLVYVSTNSLAIFVGCLTLIRTFVVSNCNCLSIFVSFICLIISACCSNCLPIVVCLPNDCPSLCFVFQILTIFVCFPTHCVSIQLCVYLLCL